MRHVGLLAVLPILVSCQEPEPPPIELSVEEFQICLEAHREYARIIDRQISVLNPLMQERLRISKEYGQGLSYRVAYILSQKINSQIQEALSAQVEAATPIWGDCYPVFQFVAAGLDGKSGDLSIELKGRR